MLLADGTAKVTWLNFVLFMIGVTDIKGAYHLVGIGLIGGENAEQITVLIEKLAEGANLIRAIQDKSEVQLEHGLPTIPMPSSWPSRTTAAGA